MYQRLFEPLSINGMRLKNRIAMPAFHLLYTPDGQASERFTRFYCERAEGGVGLITVGGCTFEAYGGATAMMSLAKDEFIPGWRNFTEEIHRRDCKVAVQLYHAGRYARSKNMPRGRPARAPSAVFSPYTKETPAAMTQAEIHETIELWAEGARRAVASGFDAVEISASAGYLVSQFLSPHTNKRQDAYGGSWENRCRFAHELVAAVRGAVGGGYPLILRMGGHDFMPGGNTPEDAIRFAQEMERAGVDMLNVTGGWHESATPQITGDLPPGGYAYLAREIRRAVSVPVAASNRMGDPCVAEETLALGRADIVCLARPLVADPCWPQKVKAGRPDEIRPCVACNQGCLAKTFFGQPVECLVNGRAGREYLDEHPPTAEKRKILVVGGGPGGCAFALIAAEAGHRVTLWEASSRLGGQLAPAAAPPGKQEFNRLIRYYETLLEKSLVEVCLGRRATPEAVRAEGYDTVVVATGAKARAIPLPAREGPAPQVVSAQDVLSGRAVAGTHVVVLGGGTVGCETAQYLARSGSVSPEAYYFLSVHGAAPEEELRRMLHHTDRVITLVEPTGKLGANFEPGTGWPVLAELKRFSVKKMTNTRLAAWGERQVTLEQTAPDAPAETLRLPCDTLVVAVGSAPEDALYEQLEGSVPHLYRLGDAHKTGKVPDAVRGAHDLLRQMAQPEKTFQGKGVSR